MPQYISVECYCVAWFQRNPHPILRDAQIASFVFSERNDPCESRIFPVGVQDVANSVCDGNRCERA